jgi:hypothetical protein
VVGPWYAAARTGARTVRQHRAGDVAHGDTNGLVPSKEDKAWHGDMAVPNGSRRQPICSPAALVPDRSRTRVRAARPLMISLSQIDVRPRKGS